MVGVGYEAPLADEKSWMYFPQADAPFYRATNFAKYSPVKMGIDAARHLILGEREELLGG